jgi:hypothetical protein
MYEKDKRFVWADIRTLGLSNIRQQCYLRDVLHSWNNAVWIKA